MQDYEGYFGLAALAVAFLILSAVAVMIVV
jgi:hypothetical protein